MTKINFKKFSDTARVPEYAHDGDAGADLFVDSNESEPLWAGETRVFWTGIGVEIPPGHVGLITGRSSMSRRGLHVQLGVVDRGYCGDLGVTVYNSTREHQPIPRGTKVAQLLIVPCMRATFEQVEELDKSDRGTGGFGSTGA